MTQNILIAPKPFADFEAEEFHAYVMAMHKAPVTKAGARPPPIAKGLAIGRTKRGALTIKRSKSRPFAYVTNLEIAALAAKAACSQAQLWQIFKAKKFIIAKDRLEAEHIYGALKEIPF